MFQNMMDKSVAKKPLAFPRERRLLQWLRYRDRGSTDPRYDAERLGFRLAGSPRQADIVVVSGPVTRQTRDR